MHFALPGYLSQGPFINIIGANKCQKLKPTAEPRSVFGAQAAAVSNAASRTSVIF
jgi:hypothetical protein